MDKINKIELCFKMGEWRSIFTLCEFKMFIANALNELYKEDEPDGETDIVGYLINPDEVYLIMHCNHRERETIVDLFKITLYREITHFLNYIINQKPGENVLRESLQNATIDKERLFTCYPINNWYLVKLLTGQNIELPYYDPRLAMLKAQIRHNNFCSVIDYSGTDGPVGITIRYYKK